MKKEALLHAVLPVCDFSAISRFETPWIYIIKKGNKLIASYEGACTAQTVTEIDDGCADFVYKINGAIFHRAMVTMGDDIELNQEGFVLTIKSDNRSVKIPTYEIDKKIKIIKQESSPILEISKDDMITIIKHAKSLRSHLFFRENHVACFDSHSVYIDTNIKSLHPFVLPNYIISVIGYLGDTVSFHKNKNMTLLKTGDLCVLYEVTNNIIDYQLDIKTFSQRREKIGEVISPKFTNFKHCNARDLFWDSERMVVKQSNVGELNYEEKIVGNIDRSFATPVLPDIGNSATIYKTVNFEVYFFEFDNGIIYVTAGVRQ